ncbi:YwiC-like family protein [Demequina sp. TTPB684]|uniref:YwiC-like family protein n=1 Tax=unclassified Demequina TaxID=2620311 RepID=UPI001CF40333|nr:YwiC-like family protein [Demequina sp. TMPB413]MCB2412970.1 YwiC-like family protein [Demequina sp. TTPB684]UPU88342.1 YwiC-like family protein [Demequina sp. TMPB413]
MTATSRAGGRKRSSVRRWIPPQHGVWAMLLLPYLAGLQFGAVWLHVPLLVVWLAGWLASYYALLALKTLRVRAVWRQVAVYGAVSAVAALPLFVVRPELLWFSPVFAVLLVVNAVSTLVGQERATGNGLASVSMASLMAMIAPSTAGLDWTLGISVAIACWLYLAGTVFYVKTMIRERGSTLHYAFSVAFHVIALVGAIVLNLWLALPFGWFLVRAMALPRRRLKVPVVGAIEVAGSAVLLGFLLALF